MSGLDQRARNLTEADVDAIVEGLCKRVKSEFYQDIGKGFWNFVWKAVIASMIGIAAYGGIKGIK